MDIDAPLLYDSEEFVAVNKPPGCHVHRNPDSGRETVLLQVLRDRLGVRLYPVHRLDRATSGVVLFGRSSAAAGVLCAHFREHTVRKRYLAVVRGFVDESGEIDDPVLAAPGGPEREALTRFRRLGTAEVSVAIGPYPSARYSLVEVEPATGRRQQIRRHFKRVGHPILGDTQHGDNRHNRVWRERFGLDRMLLHAAQLVLPANAPRPPLPITAPLDEAWRQALHVLNCHQALPPDLPFRGPAAPSRGTVPGPAPGPASSPASP